ncbi:unnamed protein product [Polarella glacialis]|uniref:FLZ-type domain-containing protein n=1 Tax=Polarella glacialis TaxID=89957 RepID=A0A813JMX6_POLGL|nr:unnamed protein product [Polarella glacialis]
MVLATPRERFMGSFENFRRITGSESALAIPSSALPDYFFRCSYCIKLVAEDSPVYMRHDYCYCSPLCRDKGLSRLYTSLRETQLQEAGRFSSGSLATSGNAKSDSSLASRTTLRTLDDMEGAGRLGPLARLGQRVIDAMLQRVASQTWGAQGAFNFTVSLVMVTVAGQGPRMNRSAAYSRCFAAKATADTASSSYPEMIADATLNLSNCRHGKAGSYHTGARHRRVYRAESMERFVVDARSSKWPLLCLATMYEEWHEQFRAIWSIPCVPYLNYFR